MPLYRVGAIDYLNSLPLHYSLNEYLKEEEGEDSFIIVKDTPSSLNKAIVEEELAVSPVSSIHYALHQRDLLVLPHLSISSLEAVGSVLLFCNKPLEELRRVALPDTSATSIYQLQILLSHLSFFQVEYVLSPPKLAKMLEIAEAALLIGDDALKASKEGVAATIYDLGTLWYQRTGEMMVHALYVVRREIAAENRDLVARIYRAHLKAKEWGLNHLEELMESIESMDLEEARNYYSHLRYGLGREELRGLRCFFDQAHGLSLLGERVDLAFWGDERGSNG